MAQRIILHLDCDYFFAQCEELRNPALKGKPVVVCVYSGRTTDSGAVGTTNYEARKFGIHSGLPIAFAKKKASPETVFLPVDIPFYSGISKKIFDTALSFSPDFEKTSIDEAFLDITEQSGGNYANAKKLAIDLKEKIRNETGITVSVGIGPNKLVAKIASGYQKPDGLTVVEKENVTKFLFPLKVSEIPGVGGKTAKVLEEQGVKTIEGLSGLSLEKLVEIFGKSKGKFLHDASLGIDEREIVLEREKKRLSVIRTLKQDAKNAQEMDGFIQNLSKELHSKARLEQVFFKTVFIIAIDSHLEMFSRAKTLEAPSDSLEEIETEAKKLFAEFFQAKNGILLRRAGVGVTNFSREKQPINQRMLSDF